MVDVGGYLRKERESRGITLEEISKVTKISTEFLKAIENNEFQKLPAEVFVVGFIRSYAKFIGLDENEVVDMYKQFVQEKKEESETEIRETFKKRRFPVLLIGGIILFIVIILLILGIFNTSKPKSGKKLKVTVPGSYPSTTTYSSSTTSPESTQFKIEIVGIARGIKPVYIQYCTDTTCKKTRNFWQEKYLQKGEKLTIRADKLIGLMVDNAGGIKIYKNGKDIGSPGLPGSTVVKFFRPGENEP